MGVENREGICATSTRDPKLTSAATQVCGSPAQKKNERQKDKLNTGICSGYAGAEQSQKKSVTVRCQLALSCLLKP